MIEHPDIFKFLKPYYKQKLSSTFVKELIDCSLAVDGTKGGLLLGAPHDYPDKRDVTCGIAVAVKDGIGFMIAGEFEGFEYMLNEGAASDLSMRHNDYNKDEDLEEVFEEYIPGKDIITIDLRLDQGLYKMKSKILVINSIDKILLANRCSSKKHLSLYNNLNKKWSQFTDPLF